MSEPHSESEAHFDEIADLYDESLPPHVVEHYLAKRVAFVRELMPAGSSILDVGCGTGVVAGRLAEAGFEVTGLDPSAGMLGHVRSHTPSVNTKQGSATELPFEDGGFDLVMCVAVMHHIADPVAVHQSLGEMVRVTRSGGLTLVWDHNPKNPYWKFLMARVPQDDGSERLIPEEEVARGLLDGGAVIEQSRRSGMVPDFVPPKMLGAAASFERMAERTPGLRVFCAHNVVVARKPVGGGPR